MLLKSLPSLFICSHTLIRTSKNLVISWRVSGSLGSKQTETAFESVYYVKDHTSLFWLHLFCVSIGQKNYFCPIETLQDTIKLLCIGNSLFLREHLHLFDQKSLCERGGGSCGDKSYYAWKNSSLLVLLSKLKYQYEEGFWHTRP